MTPLLPAPPFLAFSLFPSSPALCAAFASPLTAVCQVHRYRLDKYRNTYPCITLRCDCIPAHIGLITRSNNKKHRLAATKSTLCPYCQGRLHPGNGVSSSGIDPLDSGRVACVTAKSHQTLICLRPAWNSAGALSSSLLLHSSHAPVRVSYIHRYFFNCGLC